VPSFAELQNLFDLSVACAYLRHADAYRRCRWAPEVFFDEGRLPVAVYANAKKVPTAATAVWKGRRLMTPVGGGVCIEPLRAFLPENLLEDPGGILSAQRTSMDTSHVGDAQWWWD
jgi:hypothetical protein